MLNRKQRWGVAVLTAFAMMCSGVVPAFGKADAGDETASTAALANAAWESIATESDAKSVQNSETLTENAANAAGMDLGL